MSKEGDLAGVPVIRPILLDDPCGLRVDRLTQLTAAIEPCTWRHSRLLAMTSSLMAGLTSYLGNLA